MVTVYKDPAVNGLSTRFGRVGRHGLLNITVEVNLWLVIVEGFETNLRVSVIKDQACVMLLPHVGHCVQRYSKVSLLWRRKVGRQQGYLGAILSRKERTWGEKFVVVPRAT